MVSLFKEIFNNLPHAFNATYWKNGNTSYKEEVFLSLIKAHNIKKDEALLIAKEIFPDSDMLIKILDETYIECMGSYGDGFLGTSFYGNKTNEYKRT